MVFRDFGGNVVVVVYRKIRTHLDLLSIPQSGGKNVKTLRWDHRLQIQNLFMAFKRVRSPMVVTLGQQYNIGEKPTVLLHITLIAMQGHQKNSEDKIVHHQTWQ